MPTNQINSHKRNGRLIMKLIFTLILLFTTCSTLAQERVLTVLGVVTDGASIDVARTSLNNIVAAYRQIGSNIDLRLATSEPLPIGSLARRNNDLLTFNDDANFNLTLMDRRSQFNADVIMIFTGGGPFTAGRGIFESEVCGLAGIEQEGQWIDANGQDARFLAGRDSTAGTEAGPTIDLFGAERTFIATVVTDGFCSGLLASLPTHEFAHLFGAGHFRNPNNGTVGSDAWLETRSHASLEIETFGDFFFNNTTVNIACLFSATATATLADLGECVSVPGAKVTVMQGNFISNGNNASDQNNAATIRRTDESVASYRGRQLNLTQCNDGLDNDGDGLIDLGDRDCPFGNGDNESGTFGEVPEGPVSNLGNCTIFRPFNLRAELDDSKDCNLSPETPYRVDWTPGSICPVARYDVFARPPNGDWYEVVASPGGTQAIVLVGGIAGQNTRIRIRACNGFISGECTELTSEALNLESLCY